MTVLLPRLPFEGTPNQSARVPASRKPTLVVVHAWGNKPASSASEARRLFAGNVNYMQRPDVQVSAHVVYGGTLGEAKGQAVQLVRWERKAWTQAAVNSAAVSVESADAIWHGRDPDGMAQLARIVAFFCHKMRVPPRWARSPDQIGVARHLDLGALGNPNHHACPTAEGEPWARFLQLVRAEHKRCGFRRTWGAGVWRPL